LLEALAPGPAHVTADYLDLFLAQIEALLHKHGEDLELNIFLPLVVD
jgi:signal transduction protein with GAF and PtsI domain